MKSTVSVSTILFVLLLLTTKNVLVGWDISTVDSTGDVGHYTSIALDTSNNPHISYLGNIDGHGSLLYAKWNDTSVAENEISNQNLQDKSESFISQYKKYYPLKEGYKWRYKQTIIDTNGQEVLGFAKYQTQKIISFQDGVAKMQEEDGSVGTYRYDEKGVFKGNGSPEPSYILKWPIEVGTSWDYEDSTFDISLHSEIIAVSVKIKVPAGEFHNCIKVKVESEGSNLGPIHEYYAPNIGLIKSVFGPDRRGDKIVTSLISFSK